MSLHYVRRGRGEPLVLLHPLGGSMVVWEPILDHLAAERDVIALDMPGFGASAALADGAAPTPEGLAGGVGAFLDSLEVPDAHLVGNSLGAWVAIELARAGRGRPGAGCRASPPRDSGRAPSGRGGASSRGPWRASPCRCCRC